MIAIIKDKNKTGAKSGKKAERSNSGFTIAELLVSLSIVAIISTLALVNVGQGRRENQIKNAVRVFVSDLRRAQNMAISGKVIPGCNPLSSQRGRAGIYMDKSVAGSGQYVIFFDKNNDLVCTGSAECSQKCTGGGEAVEVISFKGGGSFANDSFRTAGGTVLTQNNWSVLFTAPDPVVDICANSACLGQDRQTALLIRFYHPGDPLLYKDVTIYNSGLIDYDY